MITILRYELNDAINDLELPIGYEVLKVGTKFDNEGIERICIWCKVDVDSNHQPGMTEHVRFLVYGTGANMDELATFPNKYLGTTQLKHNSLHALHIFEVLKK